VLNARSPPVLTAPPHESGIFALLHTLFACDYGNLRAR